MFKNRYMILTILFVAAVLRFYNLMHDYPYFFNPDERNMANSLTQLRFPSNPGLALPCLYNEFIQGRQANWKPGSLQDYNCNLNPNFYAYGQFPMYLAFASDQVTGIPEKFIKNLSGRNSSEQMNAITALSTDFPSAIFWLRFYSALSSTLTVMFIYMIVKFLRSAFYVHWESPAYSGRKIENYAALLAAFSPGLIQSAHFGTTEALLTFFFTTSVYYSLKLLGSKKYKSQIIDLKFMILISVICGLAIGSKLTGLFFLIPPAMAILLRIFRIISEIINMRKTPPSLTSFPTVLNSSSVHLFGLDSSKLGSPFLPYPARVTNRTPGMLKKILRELLSGIFILSLSLLTAVISSPYNLIRKQDFLSSVFGYERDVAMGKFEAFYTMQFKDTPPVIFQMEKVFPYVLGWPVFILGLIGFLYIIFILVKSLIIFLHNITQKLKTKKQKFNEDTNKIPEFCILIFAFLFYFIPNAFLYAKWSRFMTPILPFFYIFSAILIFQAEQKLKNHTIGTRNQESRIIKTGKLAYWLIGLLVFIAVVPGLAFMSVYAKVDSRVTASKRIYEMVPPGSYILSETANVVDIPLGLPSSFNLPYTTYNYTVISFDFYHLHENPALPTSLVTHLEKADFILIPSRRIFYNYPRFPEKYPVLSAYYENLFNGNLGFEKIAEISSFPSLLFLEFPDEHAEETFTVFDHPVIRIYKKLIPLTGNQYASLLNI